MKRIIFFTLIILFGILFADEIMQPVKLKKILLHPSSTQIGTTYRDAPNYEFVTNPTNLITTYYDYMPGSYNGIPVQVQPAVSEPNGFNAGGVYLAYHIQETTTANRKEYFNFISSDGTINPAAPIGTANVWEGYGGLAIDPIIADPFAVWHQQSGSFNDVVLSYDIYHMINGSGLWKEPFLVFDNPINTDDQFIWPYVNIGPSPLGNDYRRVYVYANNATNGAAEHPSENIYFGYADFTYGDLEAQSELDWNYFSIPLMDEWHNSETWTRPFDAVCVSEDGKVAIVGYTISDDPQYNDKMFVFLNDNYGEGNFDFHQFDMHLDVPEPSNEDGSGAFVNDDGNRYDAFFSFVFSGHFNAIFTDSGTKIRIIGSLGLCGDDPDTEESVIVTPEEYTYAIEYDIESEEFHFQILDAKINANANNPNYHWGRDQVYLPWDTDNDGENDEYDTDGNLLFTNGWPIYFYDDEAAFHENNFKLVKNEENGWLVAVWEDGLKARYANDGVAGFEDWASVPEIAICTSLDNGQSWSDVLYLNAIETPELTGMIPEYVYPGNKVEYIDGNHGKLHLIFLNDFSFGSFIQGFGLANGGMMEYASLNLQIIGAEAEPNVIPAYKTIFSKNCPNPFESSTTISFNLDSNNLGNTEVEIYNIKGQKVRKFTIDNSKSSVIWDCRDRAGKRVEAGIYYYKIRTGSFTETRKMVLMK